MWLLWKKREKLFQLFQLTFNVQYANRVLVSPQMCVCWWIVMIQRGSFNLEFLTALQQHPTLLAPVLCHSEKQLTAFDLEILFKPDLSPSGINRRLKESQTMGYWADYLLYCKEYQAAVSVEGVLMFATGLSSLPPIWLGTTAKNTLPG